MRIVPILPVGIKDEKLIKFLTDVVKSLRGVTDTACYTLTTAWQVPFTLAIPTLWPLPRQVSPQIVRLGRAVLLNEPSTPVYWGASTTWAWRGGNSVEIFDQEGLVQGVQYTLTYEVVG